MTTAKSGQDLMAGVRATRERRPIVLPPPTHKCCVHCDTKKPLADFPTNRHTRDGLSSWCKRCHNESSRRSKARKKQQA